MQLRHFEALSPTSLGSVVHQVLMQCYRLSSPWPASWAWTPSPKVLKHAIRTIFYSRLRRNKNNYDHPHLQDQREFGMLIKILLDSTNQDLRQSLDNDARGNAGRRVPLSVPYAEKDAARKLGARWDLESKVWYVPEHMDTKPFWRWMPSTAKTHVRSDSYSIAQAVVTCCKCHKRTHVFGFFVPTGFEYRTPKDGGQQWHRSPLPTILSSVTNLLPEVAIQANAIAPRLRLDSQDRGHAYWMNHCEACGEKIVDFGLHRDASGPFYAAHQPGTSTVGVLSTFNKLFECKGDVSFGGDDLFYVSLEERHYS